MITVGDLFSGIGGISLGLEATAGFRTVFFAETAPYPSRVLAKHWPTIPNEGDVRSFSLAPGAVDMLCGGFPCQEVSVAGVHQLSSPRASILGSRSGLWWEFLRLIQEGQPTWVLIENVKALLNRGLAIILHQLADLGYNAEWHIIPAYAVGYPHVRERLWVVAHRNCNGVEGHSPIPLLGLQGIPWGQMCREATEWANRPMPGDGHLLRSSNGVPCYVDRVTALGNSVIPAIPYWIGQAILGATQCPGITRTG